MKKIFAIIAFLICGITVFAQEYSCNQLKADIKVWNEVQQKNNTKWAIAIMEKGLYKQNEDGSFEYVYILQGTKEASIETLRKIGFDYITYYFNMDNASRADMVANSSEDAVFFNGKLLGVGDYVGFGEYNKINANIIFDIRFKPDRVRFCVKIQDYQVIKTSGASVLENRREYVHNCFPLNPDSDHKKSYAMAFINSNSKCLNYASLFLDYLNRNIVKAQQTVVEDW